MPAAMRDSEKTGLAMQYLRASVGVRTARMSTNKVAPAPADISESTKQSVVPPTSSPVALEKGMEGSTLPHPSSPPPGPPPGHPEEPWREDLDYDPFAERTGLLTYSNLGAAGHLLKGALGAGLLAISLGFKMSGLAVGVVSGVVIAIVCTHCCKLLVVSSRRMCKRLRVPSMDFPTTVEAAFLTGHERFRRYARPCRFMVNFMLCFTYLGLPIIFIVVISSSVQQLVEYYTAYHLNVRYFIVMLVPFVLAMGMIRDLKWLVPFSQLSNALFVLGLGITTGYVLKDMPSPLAARQTGTASDYPLFLSAMIYGMENIGVILPVENTMRHPEHLVDGQHVLSWSMALIAFFYIFIGATGFITFGEGTRENIILNLPVSEPAAQAVKVLIPLGVLLSYGLQLYVVPVTLWSGLEHRVPAERKDTAFGMLRAATVLLTVVVALVVPNLRPVLALVGAVGFSTLGLLFPALVDMVINWRSASVPSLTKNVLIILFWLTALLSGTYSAILEIRDTYFSPPQTS